MDELRRFAAEAIDQSPLRERIREFQEPRSPASLELWSRLMRRAHAG